MLMLFGPFWPITDEQVDTKCTILQLTQLVHDMNLSETKQRKESKSSALTEPSTMDDLTTGI